MVLQVHQFLKEGHAEADLSTLFRAFPFRVATAEIRDAHIHMRLTAESRHMYALWTYVSCHQTSGHSMGLVVLFS
jgi:hypothetical protein